MEQFFSTIRLGVEPVLGGDNRQYQIRHFVDFLRRDTHNPFKNDPDLPYDRCGFPWEEHSVANRLQYDPNGLGRNQESVSEDFNSWLGINTYAQVILKTSLPAAEISIYETLRDFSLMNLKLTGSSAGVQWYKNPTYWKSTVNSSSLLPATTLRNLPREQ